MPKDDIIRGNGSARNSSIQAYLRRHGNISSVIKHLKNDLYRVLLDFEESDIASEVLTNAGAIVITKSKRKLIITFTKSETYIATFKDGMIQVPPKIIDSFNLNETSTIQWRVEYHHGIQSLHLVFGE